MILASVTMGNKAVSVNCEIGQFTIGRDTFDLVSTESAFEYMATLLNGNPVATREYNDFMSKFDAETKGIIVKVLAVEAP